MQQSEREGVIALWRDVPGTKPEYLGKHDRAGSGVNLAMEAALARDAIETYLEMVAPICGFYVSPTPNPLSAKDLGGPPQIKVNFGDHQEAFQGATKLLALIAAARAVAGATNGR